MPPIITLLTDFGLQDSYVGEMKGVLLSLAPRVELVDLSHDIARGDVRAGQFVLSRAWPRFPAGTIHVAVIDPGVGTERRALAAEVQGHFFVAPDNGLLSSLPASARCVAIAAPRGAAPTFHGRDVFAPAAAALANGTSLSHLGHPVTDAMQLPPAVPRTTAGGLVGEVLHVDHFGTLITNIPAELVPTGARVAISNTDVGPVRRTFGDVAPGALLAFVGSGGTIEVAVRNGSAARALNANAGAAVKITA
jgi:S-adenosylmethionine hydrolase